MPPEEGTSQLTPESPTPVIEVPVPVAEPVTPFEAPPAPTEAVPAPETAQMGRSEPLPPEPEPFDSAKNKPTLEPPSSAASTPASVIPQTSILHTVRDVLVKASVSIQDRKRKKRDKIMTALNTRNKITNDEVEKLLHVSDATATRYLSALEKEGKIIQVGKQGKGILYIKTP